MPFGMYEKGVASMDLPFQRSVTFCRGGLAASFSSAARPTKS